MVSVPPDGPRGRNYPQATAHFRSRSQSPDWERNKRRNSVSRVCNPAHETEFLEQARSQSGDWEREARESRKYPAPPLTSHLSYISQNSGFFLGTARVSPIVFGIQTAAGRTKFLGDELAVLAPLPPKRFVNPKPHLSRVPL